MRIIKSNSLGFDFQIVALQLLLSTLSLQNKSGLNGGLFRFRIKVEMGIAATPYLNNLLKKDTSFSLKYSVRS
jgi:hypothetical protein